MSKNLDGRYRFVLPSDDNENMTEPRARLKDYFCRCYAARFTSYPALAFFVAADLP